MKKREMRGHGREVLNSEPALTPPGVSLPTETSPLFLHTGRAGMFCVPSSRRTQALLLGNDFARVQLLPVCLNWL